MYRFNLKYFLAPVALLILVAYAGCASKKKEDNSFGQSARVSVEAEKKTVIQDLCWSPNGRYIYFSAMKVKPDFSDYSPELWTVYRFDSQVQSTVFIVKSALNVAVSPSGEILAVAMNLADKRNLYLVDKNGLYPRALVTGDAKISAPTWAPDGKKIAYVSTETGTEELFTVNVDDRDRTRLTDSNAYKAYNPAWSPDGEHIVYYLEKGDGMDQIYAIKSDGTENQAVTSDSFNNIFPGWVDNQTIIYGQGQKDAVTKVFRVKLDGTGKEQVLQLESFYARYSPDDLKITYIDEKEGVIKVMSANGNLIHKIYVPD